MPMRSRATSSVRERVSQIARPNMPRSRRDRGRAPLLVGVDDDFGVGRRVEAVAGGLELAAQLAEVVDLAVEDDPDRAVLVVDRLVAGREVDDAQPAHAERHALVHPHALIVRARDAG